MILPGVVLIDRAPSQELCSQILSLIRCYFINSMTHRAPSPELCSKILSVANEMWLHQLHDLYESYHLTGTPLENFAHKFILSNEMRVHQMQVNFVISHIIQLKYHSFTTSTNHMNSRVNLIISPLVYVETHASRLSWLEQVVSIGQPS